MDTLSLVHLRGVINLLLTDMLLTNKTSEDELVALETETYPVLAEEWNVRVNSALSETITNWRFKDGLIRPNADEVMGLVEELGRKLNKFGGEVRPVWEYAIKTAFLIGYRDSLARIKKSTKFEGVNLAGIGEVIGNLPFAQEQKTELIERIQTLSVLSKEDLLLTIESEPASQAIIALVVGGTATKLIDFSVAFSNGRYSVDLKPRIQQFIQTTFSENARLDFPGFARFQIQLKKYLNQAFYFRTAVTTDLNRSFNFGAVSAFTHHGVKTYKVIPSRDIKVSEVCSLMRGKVFGIQSGLITMGQILGSIGLVGGKASVEAFPFLKCHEVENCSEVVLAAKGMAIPPYHFNCRTRLDPVDFFNTDV